MVTIADVARHAGVSPSTVSYALSGRRSISETTRRRIEHSIRLLGYHPHAGARALASARASVVALVLPLRSDMHVPVLMQFATSVVTAARASDHDVLLLTNDEGPAGLRRVAASSLVDALIIMDVELHDARIPVLRELGRPSVLIGVPADTEGLTCIDLDFAAAGALCVGHLADLGHRSIALIGQPPAVYERETGFARRMTEGFNAAVRRRGIAGSCHPCSPARDSVRETVKSLLAAQPEVTGMIVHNEPAVAPLLDTLREQGRRVPEDISVVALCPDDLAEQVSPPLTAVSIPAGELGRRAVGLVMNKLDGAEIVDTVLLAPELTARSSTAAPGTGAPAR
jgi:DNA-binding LacI/PurR family transcriptional regulator